MDDAVVEALEGEVELREDDVLVVARIGEDRRAPAAHRARQRPVRGGFGAAQEVRLRSGGQGAGDARCGRSPVRAEREQAPIGRLIELWRCDRAAAVEAVEVEAGGAVVRDRLAGRARQAAGIEAEVVGDELAEEGRRRRERALHRGGLEEARVPAGGGGAELGVRVGGGRSSGRAVAGGGSPASVRRKIEEEAEALARLRGARARRTRRRRGPVEGQAGAPGGQGERSSIMGCRPFAICHPPSAPGQHRAGTPKGRRKVRAGTRARAMQAPYPRSCRGREPSEFAVKLGGGVSWPRNCPVEWTNIRAMSAREVRPAGRRRAVARVFRPQRRSRATPKASR